MFHLSKTAPLFRSMAEKPREKYPEGNHKVIEKKLRSYSHANGEFVAFLVSFEWKSVPKLALEYQKCWI